MTARPAGRVASALGPRLEDLVQTLAHNAAEIDRSGSFPLGSVAELRSSGLFGLLVPTAFGGLGGTLHDLAEIGARLAGGCMSTALIWAMHCQQVDSIVRFGSDKLHADVLPRIAAGEVYVASVTTERGSGGHLLTARSALSDDASGVRLARDAPIVTGGEYADGFLITMRDGTDARPNHVTLVYADRSDLVIEQSGGWDALGMRGTRSVALKLTGHVPEHHVIGTRGDYRTVAVESMIPAAHISWSACWLGVARTALRDVIGLIRSPGRTSNIDPASPLVAARLARIRCDLELVSAYLNRVTDEVTELCAAGRTLSAPEVQIHINTLKIVAAERSLAAVDSLIELVGLSTGYLRSSPIPLERNLRDLRSATLNYANDRLLIANGTLILLDKEVTLL